MMLKLLGPPALCAGVVPRKKLKVIMATGCGVKVNKKSNKILTILIIVKKRNDKSLC